MKFKRTLTAFIATVSALALGTGAYANEGERTSSQRATVAQASARIVSATTFDFSAAVDDTVKGSRKMTGRSIIVRECSDAAADSKEKSSCANMRIVDLH